MSIDITLGGLATPEERAHLNPVIAAPGNLERLTVYADWLASRDPAREKFLRQYIAALKSWNEADFPDPEGLSETWLELIGFRLASRIAERNLAAFAPVVFKLARPGLRLNAEPREDDELPVGCSKFGGMPDLPPDFDWPIGDACRATYNDDTAGEQRLAGFLCQIDLDELNGTAAAKVLPETGLLSFFGFQDMENDNPDKIGVMARWFPDRSVLERRSPPGELTQGNECVEPAEFVFEEFFDLPCNGGPWQEDIQPLVDADEEAFGFGTWDNIKNMLGYAVATSGDEPTPDKQSRHLIFLDLELSEEQWPSLHIQIDESDLARRTFDKILLVWVDWD